MSGRRKINPLAKLAALVALSVTALLIVNPLTMLLFVCVVMAAKFRYRARGILTRGVMIFSVVIFLAQVVFNQTGAPVAQLWILSMTTGGIATGIVTAGKFLCLIMMSWVFISTTKASDLASALTSSGFPYRMSFMLTLSMRYVPIFRFELNTVREAQATRGVRSDGNLRGMVSSIRHTMMPLLLSAMSKVNSLVASMTGRGFGLYPTRTQLHPLRMTAWDVSLALLIIIFCAFSLMTDWSLPRHLLI